MFNLWKAEGNTVFPAIISLITEVLHGTIRNDDF